ncbi:hypothetical protein [Kitasatospora sp. MBT66]|uniref:hypothetical protein n=1 Tax=Kitasatospora sp. MBT66 TaxID=1444769 RepID=UPI0005B986AD|nr:hypothetical protein [Kitasatospora sp. MBT66]
MANDKATNPPKGECRQCWFHAYERAVHANLDPSLRECPGCADHMRNGHGDMIVR